MLLLAAHVLSDIEEWWYSREEELSQDLEIGDLYQLLHRTSVEAEAAWTLLPEVDDVTRVFTTSFALVPIALQLVEHQGNIIVWDARFYPPS